MSRSKRTSKNRLKNGSRRHGLKLPGGYRCKCCFVPEEAKAKERVLRDVEICEQLKGERE